MPRVDRNRGVGGTASGRALRTPKRSPRDHSPNRPLSPGNDRPNPGYGLLDEHSEIRDIIVQSW
jgi:hypothetical protein